MSDELETTSCNHCASKMRLKDYEDNKGYCDECLLNNEATNNE